MYLSGQQVESRKIKNGDKRESISDLGDTHIKCSNCNKTLCCIKKLTDNTTTSNIVVKCPYCNDRSFKTTIKGRFAFIDIDGLKITDFPMTLEKQDDGSVTQDVLVTVKVL